MHSTYMLKVHFSALSSFLHLIYSETSSSVKQQLFIHTPVLTVFVSKEYQSQLNFMIDQRLHLQSPIPLGRQSFHRVD